MAFMGEREKERCVCLCDGDLMNRDDYNGRVSIALLCRGRGKHAILCFSNFFFFFISI